MSFLGGLFLLALPAIAIPAAIHFLKRRRREVVAWGAMQFLTDNSNRRRKATEIDRWILLLIRTLIVACLIGALAQPVLQLGGDSGGSNMPVQVVLLDDTRSTLAIQDSGGSVFESLRSSALHLVEDFPSNTPVEIWAVGNPVRRIGEAGVSQNSLVESLRSYTARGGEADFPVTVRRSVLATLDRIAASNEGTTKRNPATNSDSPSPAQALAQSSVDVWMFCDSTQAGWDAESSAASLVSGPHQRLHLISLDNRVASGYQISIDDLRVSRQAIAANDSVQLTATVSNHGPEPSPSFLAKWQHAGSTFDSTDVEGIAVGDRRVIQTEITLDDEGTQALSLELSGLPEDRLPADDRSDVVVQVVSEIPLLIIDDHDNELGNDQGSVTDSDYLAAALGENLRAGKQSGSGSDEDSDQWRSLFRPTVLSPNELAQQIDQNGTADWKAYPTIVWTGGVRVSDAVLRQIVNRVRQGTGLWITLDSRTDVQWLNESLRTYGLIVDDSDLVGEMVLNSSKDEFQRLHTPEVTDTLLSSLSDTERLDLDEVRIRRRYDLRLPRTGPASQPLLRTFEGDCVAWMTSLQRGRVVVQSLPMRPSWSNFSLTRSYVVWVLQVLDHLSQPISTNHNLMVGQMFRSKVPSVDHEFLLDRPDGQTETLLASPQFDSGIVRYDQTGQPGTYRLHAPEDSATASKVFAVSVSAAESDVSSSNQQIIAKLVEDVRVEHHGLDTKLDFASLIAAIPRQESQKNPGRAIWPALLLGLLVALVLESFFAGYTALRRYGRTGVSTEDTNAQPSSGKPISGSRARREKFFHRDSDQTIGGGV